VRLLLRELAYAAFHVGGGLLIGYVLWGAA
jgi:hypothetical protein